MDNLLEAINDYHKNHGHYPKVKVTRAFYRDEVSDMWKLENDGIETIIDETVDQWELE